jgi:hypothetical protein
MHIDGEGHQRVASPQLSRPKKDEIQFLGRLAHLG